MNTSNSKQIGQDVQGFVDDRNNLIPELKKATGSNIISDAEIDIITTILPLAIGYNLLKNSKNILMKMKLSNYSKILQISPNLKILRQRMGFSQILEKSNCFGLDPCNGCNW